MLLYSISKTFASFAALATVCVGVDITFYVSGGCPSDAAVVECAGYGYGGCCYLNDFLAESVSFKALEDTWYGIAYQSYGNNKCGLSCGAVNGNGCVTCNSISGANWFEGPAKKRDVIEPVPVEDQTIVNRVRSQGHSFHINYDVPEDATKELLTALLVNGTRYADLPDYLLQYEIHE